MKIDSKSLEQLNFIPQSQTINKPSSNAFENYFKIALKELELQEFFQKSLNEKLNLIYQKLEESSRVLENLPNLNINHSISETIGDFLLAQALEVNKLLEAIPDSSLKDFLKDWTFFIGVEAQKIKQGFYS